MTESLYGLTLLTIAGLTVQVYRLPRTHLSYPLYGFLVSQFMFALLFLVAEIEEWDKSSLRYHRLFHRAEFMVGAGMLVLLWAFGRELSRHDLALCLGAAFGLSAIVNHLFSGPWELRLSGCFFLACGVFGLLSMSGPAGSLVDTVKIAISALWAGTGFAWIAYCGLYQRQREDLVTATEKLPVVAALLVLIALSFSLFHQSELSRQPLPEAAQVEAQQ